jgi:AraC-like DNA-binding protein
MSRYFPVPVGEAVPLPGLLRINAIWDLPVLLRELGLELAEVLAAAGVNARIFENPDNPIAYPDLERLLLECERRSGRDDFGFLIGQRSRLRDMGLAGRIALCGATAGAGLRNFVEHFNLHDSAALVSVLESEEFVRFVYAISEHGMTGTRHFQLGGITIAFNILQDLCGRDCLPSEVRFACRAPANPKPMQKFFRAPLRFDNDESSLVFSRAWLARAMPSVEATERQRVRAAIREQHAQVLANFPATVRRILRKQFLLGRGSMDEVAALLGMHRRTLDRRLQRDGAQFGAILESVKADVARQLLTDTNASVQQIADALHYSSGANFATAFRHWFGTTPTAFRRGAAQPPSGIASATSSMPTNMNVSPASHGRTRV